MGSTCGIGKKKKKKNYKVTRPNQWHSFFVQLVLLLICSVTVCMFKVNQETVVTVAFAGENCIGSRYEKRR